MGQARENTWVILVRSDNMEEARTRTGWTLRRILKRLGLKSVYYEWRARDAEDLLDDFVFAGHGRPPMLC